MPNVGPELMTLRSGVVCSTNSHQQPARCPSLSSSIDFRLRLFFSLSSFFFFFLKIYLFIYLFMRDTERKAETQEEGEAGSMQGARHGTRSCDSRITPWTEGGAKPLSHWGCPKYQPFN